MNEQGTQNIISKKEAYIKERDEKLAARLRDSRKNNIKRLVYSLLAVAVVGALGFGLWWWLGRLGPQNEIDASAAFPVLGRGHVSETSTRPTYNSNPPTSGPHYAEPARLGLYDKELPDERVVHNLEHGEIWISYHPRVKDQVEGQLKALLSSRVIITPRQTNDTDIAVAAWGRLDKFNLDGKELDVVRISDFIKRYQNQGPEHLSSDTMVSEGAEQPIERP